MIEPGFGHSPAVDEALDPEAVEDAVVVYDEIIEEDSSIEDPVKMYLHEIGRGQLLTADEEKWLACRLEEAARLKDTIHGLEAVLGRPPTPAEAIGAVYARVYERRQALQHVASILDLEPVFDVPVFLGLPRLRESIDYFLEPTMLDDLAARLNVTAEESRADVVVLSVDTRLLPLAIRRLLGRANGLREMPTPAHFADLLTGLDLLLADHMTLVRREASRAVVAAWRERHEKIRERLLMQPGPAADEAIGQMIREVAQPCEPEAVEWPREARPDAFQPGGFGEQRVEEFGTHDALIARRADFPNPCQLVG